MREDDHDGGAIPCGYVVAGWSHDVAWSIMYTLSETCQGRSIPRLSPQTMVVFDGRWSASTAALHPPSSFSASGHGNGRNIL
eukprot:COSAG01_NODE_6947_length_3426_cov_13.114217_1_plen_81_part_10